PHPLASPSLYRSGRFSRPSLRTERLITWNETRTGRTFSTSSSQREVIHAHGHLGSNHIATLMSAPRRSKVLTASCRAAPVPATAPHGEVGHYVVPRFACETRADRVPPMGPVPVTCGWRRREREWSTQPRPGGGYRAGPAARRARVRHRAGPDRRHRRAGRRYLPLHHDGHLQHRRT